MIESLSALDRKLFLFLNSLNVSFLDPVMTVLSGQIIWIPLIGYFFYYSYKKTGKIQTIYFGLFLVMAIVASDVTSSYIFKNIFNRLRPCRELDLKPLIYQFNQKCGGKFGFVSSHAANSALLVYFSIRTLNFEKRYIYLLILIPLLVGYSRIYLGVHYPGDILGGMIVGLFWGHCFSGLFKELRR